MKTASGALALLGCMLASMLQSGESRIDGRCASVSEATGRGAHILGPAPGLVERPSLLCNLRGPLLDRAHLEREMQGTFQSAPENVHSAVE